MSLGRECGLIEILSIFVGKIGALPLFIGQYQGPTVMRVR